MPRIPLESVLMSDLATACLIACLVKSLLKMSKGEVNGGNQVRW